MNVSKRRYKVQDTRKRSFFKALTCNVLEIALDTLIIGTILNLLGMSHPYEFASGFSAIVQIICFITNYVNDRIWNKVQWGREVDDIA